MNLKLEFEIRCTALWNRNVGPRVTDGLAAIDRRQQPLDRRSASDQFGHRKERRGQTEGEISDDRRPGTFGFPPPEKAHQRPKVFRLGRLPDGQTVQRSVEEIVPSSVESGIDCHTDTGNCACSQDFDHPAEIPPSASYVEELHFLPFSKVPFVHFIFDNPEFLIFAKQSCTAGKMFSRS